MTIVFPTVPTVLEIVLSSPSAISLMHEEEQENVLEEPASLRSEPDHVVHDGRPDCRLHCGVREPK